MIHSIIDNRTADQRPGILRASLRLAYAEQGVGEAEIETRRCSISRAITWASDRLLEVVLVLEDDDRWQE